VDLSERGVEPLVSRRLREYLH